MRVLVVLDRAAARALGNSPTAVLGVRPWWVTVSTVLMLGALASSVWESFAGP